MADAMDAYLKLPPNPNIVKVLSFDRGDKRLLTEKLDMDTLDEMIVKAARERSKEKRRDIGVQVLRAFHDCLKGARFLSDNGIVMQDIKVENLGRKKDTGDGVLFDIDSILPKGSTPSGRMYTPGYYPPEASSPDGLKISSSEMVYQFGIALQRMVGAEAWDLPADVRTFLEKDLSFGMRGVNPKHRMSLERVEQLLGMVVEDLAKRESGKSSHTVDELLQDLVDEELRQEAGI
jgi:serine/threonine protein kinase